MTFVAPNTQIDLSNCDREPIHIPGQIQAHGVLFAVDRRSFEILQVSDNVTDGLGREPPTLLGSDVRLLFEPVDRASIARIFEQGHAERAPLHVSCASVAGTGQCDVIIHTDGPLAIIEIERANQSDQVAPDFYEFASRTVTSLHDTPTTRDYCDALASAIRELSGYDQGKLDPMPVSTLVAPPHAGTRFMRPIHRRTRARVLCGLSPLRSRSFFYGR